MRFIDLIQSGLKGDDKLIHSRLGNIVWLLTTIFFSVVLKSVWAGIFFGILFTFAIAFWKELYDKYVKKTFFDWWDIVAAFVPYPIVKFLNED